MTRPYPRAGAEYPKSLGEFQAWFQADADCLDYLEWLRWPSGFVCPACGNPAGWRIGDGRFMCAGCGKRTSVTAGTIFDRTRTPLTVWFAACWHFATGKDGISALSLKRTLEIGSYQTVWAILHRLRSVLVRPDRERLSGKVEVDETYIGGVEPGLSGGRAQGKKVLTVIAVEILEPKGWGRCRMAPIADSSASSLLPFVKGCIEPGSTVITDGWNGYMGIEREGYIRDRRSQRAARARGEDAGELLPAVHRIAALAKRCVTWYPPGRCGCRPPAELPQRVRVPIQPSAFTQPRDAVLPCPGTCGCPCTRPVRGPRGRPASQGGAAQAPRSAGAPAQSGYACPGPAMAISTTEPFIEVL